MSAVPALEAPVPAVVPPAAVPAIETEGLTKRFRTRRTGAAALRTEQKLALAPTSLRVDRGECVAVLGPNGSGKSTLVRLLATLLVPDDGRARIFGHDLAREPRAVRRLVNRVSVEASFFKKLSVVENLGYVARFYGLAGPATRARIGEILERIGFPATRAREPMENLSRGMQQKVALARALLTSPVLLLLDEPTTGLDPRSKREVQDLVVELRATHDSTIVLCTHDLAEAEALAERVGILDRGRLLVLEPPEALRRRYGVGSLEEVFFAATGRELVPDEDPDEDPGEGPDEGRDEGPHEGRDGDPGEDQGQDPDAAREEVRP